MKHHIINHDNLTPVNQIQHIIRLQNLWTNDALRDAEYNLKKAEEYKNSRIPKENQYKKSSTIQKTWRKPQRKIVYMHIKNIRGSKP